MSDSDSDKTVIKKPLAASPVTPSEDATRLTPPKKTAPVADESDKTRIAPATSQPPGSVAVTTGEDKTRIAPQVVANDSEPDVTRFKPPSSPPAEDRTRIPPLTQPPVTQQTGGSLEADQPYTIDPPVNESPLPVSSGEIEQGEHGTLKKRFVLEKVLGVGGMGIVYKAKDLLKVEAHDRDPYVAIKVLSEEFKSHPEAFISLQRESRKSQRIAHPNIVNVHDFDRDDDTVFMTMEFLDGSPLDQLIRQYKATGLPTDYAWDIINGMSAALSYAHAEKIIHSDFKPGNVFVTKKGVAKVFDFGIARAVAKVEHLEDNPEDKTIFDAGNLGALTPAYASLEMLEGKEPDIRDDIYALGCVAYELFTGEHPYNKVPADEAQRQGLKPKRITTIKKAQWRAIEKAIAFKREDRMATVDKFLEAVSPSIKPANRLATALALLLSVFITGYFLFIQEKQPDPYSEFDIRNELELKIRIDFTKEDLANLLKDPRFTDPWQDSTWKDISDLVILTKGEDPWVDEQKQVIYKLYLDEINTSIKDYKYTQAKSLIVNAKRYTKDMAELDLQLKQIAAAIERDKNRMASRSKQKQQDMIEQQRQPVAAKPQVSPKQKTVELFDVALENVNNQLKCQGRLNMRNFETAVIKLRELDRKRYNDLQDKVVKSLASCITQIGKAFPERALEAKKHSLRIFPSNRVLAAISIQDRDPCDHSLAGLGARGKRALCKDTISKGGSGPVLVVIPGNSRIKTFAIGKYEVSIDELNQFCGNSSACSKVKGRDVELPASELGFDVVKDYLKWLSKQSGYKYRLPTKTEWVYAAQASRKTLDANRNCKLSTRGIQKGEELVKASIGKQNPWGLVNYVGNVQEWVYDKGRKLVAVGGSYKESMDNCDVNTTNAHNGSADRSTGFRILRELRTDS